MKTQVKIFAIFLLITSAFSSFSQSSVKAVPQDSLTVFEIETIDGNVYIGTIIKQDNKLITFKANNLGTILLIKQDIVSMEIVEPEQLVDGQFWAHHMQSTRYFWQPNGYGLKKGEAYYQNVWILFNQFSVGVTDNFLIGGGIMPLFLFGGAPTPVWLTPKFSIPIIKDKLNLGVGALFAYILGGEIGLGMPYATATVGPRDKNFSVGMGYGRANGEWASRPTFSFSALIRTGKKGYFLTENYYIGNESGSAIILMIGGRRIIGQKAGLDFGLVMPIISEADKFVGVPWLGLTVPLGRPKSTF
jgi:hypothetical protein